MTAIKKFSRLESKAVWIENNETSSKSVIISFGKSSIIISDTDAIPLDHWNFNSISILSKDKNIFTLIQSENPSEKLVIEDKDMNEAIELICDSQNSNASTFYRLKKILLYIPFLILILFIFYLPLILTKALITVTEPKNEIIYYNQSFKKLISNFQMCDKSLIAKNFETKIKKITKNKILIDIIILNYNLDYPIFLPGGKVIIPSSWIIKQKTKNNFNRMINSAINANINRKVFEKFLNEQNSIKILYFILGHNISFDLKLDSYSWKDFDKITNNPINVMTTDEEWIDLKNSCYN